MQPWCRRLPALLLLHPAWLFNSDCYVSMLLRPVSVSLSLPGHICYQLGTAISMYHLLPGAWRRWRSMAEAFSSPSSCIEDRSGIFFSVFLSPPACPACVVPGCWARGGCTAVTQLCSGKAQGAAELSLPLHPPGLWHCLSFPTWNFPVHRGFYCPESAVTTGQLQGLLLCSPLVKKISLVKKKRSCQPSS